MKTVQFIFLLALVSAPAWGNNAKVDSLKQLLEQHSTADKAEVLWGIAYELFDVDNAQALFYADRAYHEVWKRGDSLQIVKVGTTYGQLLRRMGKVDRSIEISSRMLPIAERHKYRKYWKMLLNSLSMGYAYREDFSIALDYIYEFLGFAEEDNDNQSKVLALHNIGFLMYKLNDFDRSISYSLKSIELATRIEHENLLPSTILNIGAAHLGLKNYDSALVYTLKSLKIRERNGSGLFAPHYQHLAFSYFGLRKYDSAVNYSNRTIDLALKEGHPFSLGICYNLLSRIALVRKNKIEAGIYLERAIEVSRGADFPLLELEVLRQVGRHQAALGNLDSTMKVIDKYYDLNDSLYHGQKEAAVRNVQIRYDERENRRQIAMQSSILKMQEGYMNQQRSMILIVTSFLVIVILLSIALYNAYRRVQQINLQLDQRVMDRTRELSKHRDALQHLIDEENGRRSRATAELTSMLGSLKGLLHLAKVDPEQSHHGYLEKAIGLTSQIEDVSNKYSELTNRKPLLVTQK